MPEVSVQDHLRSAHLMRKLRVSLLIIVDPLELRADEVLRMLRELELFSLLIIVDPLELRVDEVLVLRELEAIDQ